MTTLGSVFRRCSRDFEVFFNMVACTGYEINVRIPDVELVQVKKTDLVISGRQTSGLSLNWFLNMLNLQTSLCCFW